MLGLGQGLRDNLLATSTSKLCKQIKDELRNWKVLDGLSVKDAKKLSKSGRLEQKRMGSRIQRRIPAFFSGYSQDEFLIRHSKKERAQSSAKEFFKGMFPEENVLLEQVKGNPITRYYDNCPKWNKEVDHSEQTLKQRNKFEESSEFMELLLNLTNLLGVEITLKDVDLMYDTCRFEMAWSPESSSPWCSIFSEEQIKLINFAKDLKYYYLNGYGTKLNQQVACPALKDFLSRAEDKINSSQSSSSSYKPSPKAVFYFSHSDGVMMLLSSLGLFQDSTPLTAQTFKVHGNHRYWNTSNIAPFSGNLAFVVLQCDDGHHRVETLHNEKKIVMKNCGEECTWENFNRIFGSFRNCDQQEICALSGGNANTGGNFYIFIFLTLNVIISY